MSDTTIAFTEDADLKAILRSASQPEYEVVGGDPDGFLNPLVVETGAGYVALKGVGYDSTLLTYSADQLEDLIEVLINAAIDSREKEEVARAAFSALEGSQEETLLLYVDDGVDRLPDQCCGGGCG